LKTTRQVKVRVVAMDDFFDENTTIDYFRMDVEGYEDEIIKGMGRLLTRQNRPAGCFIEVHSELLHKLGSSALDFASRMKAMGYGIKRASYRGRTDIQVAGNRAFERHPLREKGYWEAFFSLDG